MSSLRVAFFTVPYSQNSCSRSLLSTCSFFCSSSKAWSLVTNKYSWCSSHLFLVFCPIGKIISHHHLFNFEHSSSVMKNTRKVRISASACMVWGLGLETMKKCIGAGKNDYLRNSTCNNYFIQEPGDIFDRNYKAGDTFFDPSCSAS